METILSGLLGIMIGGAIAGMYFFRKNSELYTQILDKQTIIKLIKDHMAKAEKSKPKPRRNYRKPSTRKSSNKTTEKVV
tara:strand:+ start:206 stop:442 length:237 start_codon:yes stop_codon:yes gene_type:complete